MCLHLHTSVVLGLIDQLSNSVKDVLLVGAPPPPDEPRCPRLVLVLVLVLCRFCECCRNRRYRVSQSF